jgi:hypothetical protein
MLSYFVEVICTLFLKTLERWRRVLKLILDWAGGSGLDSLGSGYGPVVASSEHVNGSSEYINDGEFIDY